MAGGEGRVRKGKVDGGWGKNPKSKHEIDVKKRQAVDGGVLTHHKVVMYTKCKKKWLEFLLFPG